MQLVAGFQGSELTDEEQSDFFKEVLVMTLSRASNSDSNIHPGEIGTIQKIIKQAIGDVPDVGTLLLLAAGLLAVAVTGPKPSGA